MPWPEPDPRDIKVTRAEFWNAILSRILLLTLFVLILIVMFAPGLLR